MEWIDSLRGQVVGLDTAPRLRAERNISTPDAIQIATAIDAGASFFVTNDSGLPAVADLRFLILDDLKGDG